MNRPLAGWMDEWIREQQRTMRTSGEERSPGKPRRGSTRTPDPRSPVAPQLSLQPPQPALQAGHLAPAPQARGRAPGCRLPPGPPPRAAAPRPTAPAQPPAWASAAASAPRLPQLRAAASGSPRAPPPLGALLALPRGRPAGTGKRPRAGGERLARSRPGPERAANPPGPWARLASP